MTAPPCRPWTSSARRVSPPTAPTPAGRRAPGDGREPSLGAAPAPTRTRVEEHPARRLASPLDASVPAYGGRRGLELGNPARRRRTSCRTTPDSPGPRSPLRPPRARAWSVASVAARSAARESPSLRRSKVFSAFTVSSCSFSRARCSRAAPSASASLARSRCTSWESRSVPSACSRASTRSRAPANSSCQPSGRSSQARAATSAWSAVGGTRPSCSEVASSGRRPLPAQRRSFGSRRQRRSPARSDYRRAEPAGPARTRPRV